MFAIMSLSGTLVSFDLEEIAERSSFHRGLRFFKFQRVGEYSEIPYVIDTITA
jgi:hypothetical protein